jgi:hypothetical protein
MGVAGRHLAHPDVDAGGGQQLAGQLVGEVDPGTRPGTALRLARR